MKVLLVEDNERMAQIVRKGLTEKGRMVDHAGNGRDGSCLAAAGRYDVIILSRVLTGGTDGLYTMHSVGYRLSADA
jgi:two-component system, OmpR family, response regulator